MDLMDPVDNKVCAPLDLPPSDSLHSNFSNFSRSSNVSRSYYDSFLQLYCLPSFLPRVTPDNVGPSFGSSLNVPSLETTRPYCHNTMRDFNTRPIPPHLVDIPIITHRSPTLSPTSHQHIPPVSPAPSHLSAVTPGARLLGQRAP